MGYIRAVNLLVQMVHAFKMLIDDAKLPINKIVSFQQVVKLIFSYVAITC